MTRSEILHEAERCVCGQREQDYGTPEESFSAIAKYWSAYLSDEGFEIHLKPVDVGIMMALFKIARIETGTATEDSFVDACGYLACAGEIATRTDETDVVVIEKGTDSKYEEAVRELAKQWRCGQC